MQPAVAAESGTANTSRLPIAKTHVSNVVAFELVSLPLRKAYEYVIEAGLRHAVILHRTTVPHFLESGEYGCNLNECGNRQ